MAVFFVYLSPQGERKFLFCGNKNFFFSGQEDASYSLGVGLTSGSAKKKESHQTPSSPIDISSSSINNSFISIPTRSRSSAE
jgi:hypothetical protein